MGKRKRMRSCFLLAALLLAHLAGAQESDGSPTMEPVEKLETLEIQMAAARKAVRKARADSARFAANNTFLALIDTALALPESRNYPFDSLNSTMAVLEAPDNTFRLLNWNIPANDGTHEYFGYVQTVDPETQAYRVQTLKDQSWNLDRPLNKQLTAKKWFGALYYEIIAVELDKSKRVYTLLGWDGNNQTTQKKVIEVMELAPNGDVRFGVPMFKTEKGMQRRMIFEYSNEASMSLRYHPRNKQIVFDHLSPRAPELEGMWQFYGPDLSYDALKLKKGKWQYMRDVDVRTDDRQRVWNKPK